MAKLSRKAIDWLALVCIDATVPAVIVWKHHSGEVTAAVALTSSLISLGIGSAVFLGAVHSRNRRRGQGTSRGFLVSAAGLAVISALVTAGAIYLTPQRNDYVDLALSDTPLSQIHPQRKAIIVELLRRRLEISQEYQKEAAQMKPISPALYSPASFASASVMHEVTEGLTHAYDTDISNNAEQRRSMDEFRVEMGKADPEYLKSFEATDQKDEEERNNIMDLEEKWFDSTIALYKYAGSHSDEITVSEGQLRFANNTVQSDFSRQLRESKNLYSVFQKQVQNEIRDHRRNRRKLGLASDF
jgi:hypothetical protein